MLEKHLPIHPRTNKDARKAHLLPPPNITGNLHMGHAYEHTLIDHYHRFKNMQGLDLELLPGLDHAAIATNRILRAKLESLNLSKELLGREAYNQYAWGWKQFCQAEQIKQMQALGLSATWEKLTFTLDPEAAKATEEAFKTLWDRGLIYQAEKATPWCPGCQTTISDIEAEEGRCSRCASPLQTKNMRQTYLKMKPLAENFRRLIEEKPFETNPASKLQEMLAWAEKTHDWCISRQLWWGHRIPLWHKGTETSPLEKEGWEQDPDSLDTWFTSSLWPLALKEKTGSAKFETLHTGNDLLFFWALRMSMLTGFMTGELPFEKISFHGMIRDEHGRKMSKSFGNTIDPEPAIKKWGADTLRLSFLRNSRPGADIALAQSEMKGARGMLDKLWNTTRYGLGLGCSWEDQLPKCTHPLDRWLINHCSATFQEATRLLEKEEHAKAYTLISKLLFEDISSTYISTLKARQDEDARRTLSEALRTIITLLHPGAPGTTQALAFALGGPDQLTWQCASTFIEARDAELYHQELTSITSTLARLAKTAGRKADLSNLSRPDLLMSECGLGPGEAESMQTFKIGNQPWRLEIIEDPKQSLKRKMELAKLERLLSDRGFLEHAPMERQEKMRTLAAELKAELEQAKT